MAGTNSLASSLSDEAERKNFIVCSRSSLYAILIDHWRGTISMCGIAGFVAASPIAGGDSETIAERMAASLSHRGPDDQGIWR
ncbi:MAG: hypothetical protein WBE57_11680, partial [Xanthobacteraceae bacterium]